MDLAPNNPAGVEALAERLIAYMIKAVREAKEQSSWSNPNAAYEAGVQRFVRSVLDASRTNPFLARFHGFFVSLARPGAISSLSQVVLKLTVPGVPDIYHGGELWDFNLVDPDNRRAVDWALRNRLIAMVSVTSVADLGGRYEDGREKIFVIHRLLRLLRLRRSRPELFAEADYQPLEVEGESGNHLCAFIRSRGDQALPVAVPRLVGRLYVSGTAEWGSTTLRLPTGVWRECSRGARTKGWCRFPVSLTIFQSPCLRAEMASESELQRRPRFT
jgi:(1->4)-alpha-D-glucan 1-alpha-D-glucosylmutase